MCLLSSEITFCRKWQESEKFYHQQAEDEVLSWRYSKGLHSGNLRSGIQKQKSHGHRYCLVGGCKGTSVLESGKVTVFFTRASFFPFLGSSSLKWEISHVSSQYQSGTCKQISPLSENRAQTTSFLHLMYGSGQGANRNQLLFWLQLIGWKDMLKPYAAMSVFGTRDIRWLWGAWWRVYIAKVLSWLVEIWPNQIVFSSKWMSKNLTGYLSLGPSKDVELDLSLPEADVYVQTGRQKLMMELPMAPHFSI